MPGFLSAQSLKARELSEGVLVQEGKDSVLFYVTAVRSMDGKYSRSDYIHPLWGLNGGQLTLDFPEDHPHHRGVFWAWRRIRVGGKYAGDAWVCTDFTWDVKNVEVKNAGDSILTLRVQVLWLSSRIADDKGNPVPFVAEDLAVHVHKRKLHYRIIDISIGLKALKNDVEIAGYDNESELSGFSIRMKTPEDLVFLSTEGRLKPRWPAMKAGPWVDISGSLEPGGKRSGVTIMTSKYNPPPENTWNLRQENSMQNVVFPGKTLYLIPMDRQILLRYRLVIHDDHWDVKKIDPLYESFSP